MLNKTTMPDDRQREVLAAVLCADEMSADLRHRLESVDSGSLGRFVLKARVGGLFIQACTRLGIEIEPQVENDLQLQATRTAAGTIAIVRAFAKVATRLHQDQIPFLVLKGAALSGWIYPRPDLRPMTDVDILIHASDVSAVDEALRDCGCRAGRDLVCSDFFPRYYHEREYDIPGPPTCRLELHAHLLRPLRYISTVPPQAMWDQPRAIELNGVQVSCPSAEDMLIHLAAHSAIHGNPRLLWLYDVYRLVRDDRDRIDFASVEEKSVRWRIAPVVHSGLSAAAQLFNDEFLLDVCRRFSPSVTWQDRLVLWQAPRDSRNPLAHVITNLLTTPSLRLRAGYLRSTLLPDPTHMGEMYHWRHPGWLACAHGWRFLRPAVRPVVRLLTRLRDPGREMEIENTAQRG